MNSLGVTLLGLMPIFNVDMSDPKAANFTSDIVGSVADELALHYKPIMTVDLTNYGRVRGIKLNMKNSNSFTKTDYGLEYIKLENTFYDAFYGVPYANPPVGELRFANPVPIQPWNTILSNDHPVEGCIFKTYKFAYDPVYGKEDCLHLNIFRPHNSRRKLPVMVYMHGGDFSTAPENILNPESFMITRRVILVLVSFRIGPFGFLSTNDKVMPGNFGLKDQRIALLFIKTFIESFGGDPNQITIFGHDTGAVSCHLHTMNPISTRYFNQAIIMSGNAIAPYTRPVKDPLAQAQKILNRNRRQDDTNVMNTKEILSELRKMDVKDILVFGYPMQREIVVPYIEYRYVIERDGSNESFLRRDPLDSLTEEKSKAMPLMFTFVSNEGFFNTHEFIGIEKIKHPFNETFYSKLKNITGLSESTGKKIINYYTNHPKIKHDLGKQFVQMFSDYEYLFPLYKTIKSILYKQSNSKEPIFLLKIDFEGKLSRESDNLGLRQFSTEGLPHNEDVALIFTDALDYVQDTARGSIIRAYINELINFAEKNFNQLQECKKEKFMHADVTKSEICEYKELFASEKKKIFQTHNRRYFDVATMNLWSRGFK